MRRRSRYVSILYNNFGNLSELSTGKLYVNSKALVYSGVVLIEQSAKRALTSFVRQEGKADIMRLYPRPVVL